MILDIDEISYFAATRHLRETKWTVIKNEDADMNEHKNEDKAAKV
jgi:hypothetical protein